MKLVSAALLAPLLVPLPTAQLSGQSGARPPARQWIAPTARARAFASSAPVEVTALAARVRIDGAVAEIRLRITVENPESRAAEAELLVPVPEGAVVDHFDFQGSGAGAARLLAAGEARATYDEIVTRLRDPALLEFAGQALLRSSVFPVPPGGTQRIELGYHQVLAGEGERLDYVLPRTAALGATTPLDLELEVVGPVATVYSPSHALLALERSAERSRFRVDPGVLESGSFHCAILAGTGPHASLYACPDEHGNGGTFLLFAGASLAAGTAVPLPREVTLVLDRSGSMAGGKFDQARAAALQVLESLRTGECFRIVDYADDAAASSAAPEPKSAATTAAARAYLAGLATGGGTNLAAALTLALAPPARSGHVPVVLLLTDGLPTVGTTDEAELGTLARRLNTGARRFFPFGVGHDVNAPLLDRLAQESRGRSTYVQPSEDVEVAVGGLFRRLEGPVLAGLELVALDGDDQVDATLVRDLVPRTIPDLFAGEPLVLVGRYTAARVTTLELRPTSGLPLRFRVDFARATRGNEFVPRLWATRRVGELTDAIRQIAGTGQAPAALLDDPRTKELSDEILALSLRYGILSDFTAFLALEGSPLVAWDELERTTRRNLVLENGSWRSGARAVQYAENNGAMQQSNFPNHSNVRWQGAERSAADGRGGAPRASRLQAVLTVEPVRHGALFRRGNEWIEGELLPQLEGTGEPRAERTVVVGTSEQRALAEELAREGRSDLLSRGQVLFRHHGELVRQVLPPAAPENR